MKTWSLLAAAACLLWIVSPAAAEPKNNRAALGPRAEKLHAADGFQAKAGGGGKVSTREKVLAEFDANGNGKLDPDEQAAARKAGAERRKSRKQKPGPGGGADPFNQPQGIQPLNGQPLGGGNAGQRGNGRAKLMERFDLNRDGILSPQEEARAKEMMQKHGGVGAKGGSLPPDFGPKQNRTRVPVR